MTALEKARAFWPKDRVFDFLIPEMPPDLDVTHGVILYLEGITVSFEGFKAINDLNLYIENGELRCIIGPNGAGKTTIMDIITGKTKPDTGSVWFGQRINLLKMNEPEIANAGIGRKFQKPSVFENHTVHENLELAMGGGKPIWSTLTAKLNQAEQDKIEAVLQTVGLREKIKVRAGSLSHGQKQWLEIGMLLMQNPKLPNCLPRLPERTAWSLWSTIWILYAPLPGRSPCCIKAACWLKAAWTKYRITEVSLKYILEKTNAPR
jgi:urea transport system ATP-binding protein